MRFQKLIISCLVFIQLACSESEETMPPPGTCQPDVCEGVCVANVCTDPSNMPDDPSTGPQCPGNETDCNVACAWAVSCMVGQICRVRCQRSGRPRSLLFEPVWIGIRHRQQTCATNTCEATLLGSRRLSPNVCAPIYLRHGVMAMPEVCDGTDNDLDGTVDEEVTPDFVSVPAARYRTLCRGHVGRL